MRMLWALFPLPCELYVQHAPLAIDDSQNLFPSQVLELIEVLLILQQPGGRLRFHRSLRGAMRAGHRPWGQSQARPQ